MASRGRFFVSVVLFIGLLLVASARERACLPSSDSVQHLARLCRSRLHSPRPAQSHAARSGSRFAGLGHPEDATPPEEGNLSSRGAPGSISFRRLGLEDGLSQVSINCILQDADGFMWFGTQEGLNRYDGYDVKVYRHDPQDRNSLSHSFVRGCETDRRDVMWVVTNDAKLHRYEPEEDRFVRYDLALEDPFGQSGGEFTVLHGDAEGRLWIGTFGDGLVRYDPERDGFSYYRHDPADPTTLSHRIVWYVYEDREGTIWVGTEGGLNRYDQASDGFVRYPYQDFPPGGYQYDPPVHDDDPALQPHNPHALASPAVTRLLEDQAGRLWVGTRYGGLNRLDRETGEFVAYPYDPSFEPSDPSTFSGNSVHFLLKDDFGHIWVSSRHWNLDETRTYARLGLERLDPETGQIVRYPAASADEDDPCRLSHDAVLRMFEDSRGTLWFHTFAGGLDVYDRETGCFRRYAHDPDDEETLGGDDVTRFYEDDAGGLWIGTSMGGANYYDPTWAKFAVYRVGAPSGERYSNNSIWRIAPSPGRVDEDGHAHALWVSTFAGLNYWDRSTDGSTFYEIDPKLPDDLAYAVHEDGKRRMLWLGTTMGLERARLPRASSSAPSTLAFTRVLTRSSASSGYVLAMHPAGEDELWIAQYAVGLSLFNLESEEVVATYRHDPDDETSLGDDRVMQILGGRRGTLWLITRSGIEQFDPETETFTRFPSDADDRHDLAETVYAVHEDQQGRVWVGTDSRGLQRLDRVTGSVVASYSEQDGLPSAVVYAILPDEAGRLWLSTVKGLACFDPGTEAFQNYTSHDGLQSNEFNYGAALRAPDGELFFGGVDGINAFHPSTVGPNQYVPPVVITNIVLGPPQQARAPDTPPPGRMTTASDALLERPPHATDEIELSYRERILSFEFAALHYAVPERNQYAYRLEGFDPEWNYVGNLRFATYTNLPPGSYRFRVKGSNSDGVWNEEGASVAVTITPPFWVTWWFRTALGLCLVGAAFAAYRLRVRSIEARSRELEREVAERTEELAAVNAIADVVSRSLELDAILADALEKTLEVMDIAVGGIYLLEEEAGLLTIAVQRGFSGDLVADIDRLSVGEGFSGRVARSRKALVVDDISQDSRLTRMSVQEQGLRSLAVAPLMAKGDVLGTIFVVSRGHRAFSDQDVNLLVAIGQQIGVAVHNAALYEATSRRLAQLAALQETITAVASTLELERLLRLIVQQATSLLQADGGILNLVDWEAHEDEVVAAAGLAVDSVGARTDLESGLSGWVTLQNEPVISNDVRADGRTNRRGLAALEAESGKTLRNAAAVPLRIKNEVLGTLIVVNKQGGESDLDASDLSLLQAFGNQAATAIENARLFEAEQRRADQFRVISEVGRRTTSILSIDDLLHEMVCLIHDSFDYDIVEIGLVEGDDLVFQAGVDGGCSSPFPGFRVRVGQDGITGWVAATGEPLLVPDVTQDERFVQFTETGTRTLSELAVPIKTKETTIGVLNVQSARMSAFDESDLAVLQALADQAATAIENARLFGAEQRRAEQFRVINEVGRRITSITSIDSALKQVVQLIQSAFGYDHVHIGLVEGDEVIFRVGAGRLWQDPDFRFEPTSLKVGQNGVAGWVAATGEPALLPDVSQDRRYVWMEGSDTRSEITVPLTLKGRVIGVLDAQSDRLDAFDQSDLLVLQALAGQAAIAIENARLYERAQRLAVVEERQRLARELHDSVTQALYGTTLYAEAAARQLGSGEAELAAEHLHELRDTAQEALREMRLLIFELRPSVLESEGLVDALRTRLEAVEERAGLEVRFQVKGQVPISPLVEEGLYRIAQEALNNALKHASAASIGVYLDYGEDAVTLEVVDDGCGFDPALAIPGGGLGLDGMLERAGQLGGELVLDSEPRVGTRVKVEVPL